MSTASLPSEKPVPAGLQVRLYIAGDAPNSAAALATLRAVLARSPTTHVEVEIVDLLKDPERGVRDRVFVAPMLVRSHPLPERRILGNLSDRPLLLSVLGVLALDEERGE